MRGLFLDRDGTINVDHGYVGTSDRFEWVEGAREAVALATQSGWRVFIVTNQSGVARGHYTEDDVRSLLAWITEECRSYGGTIHDTRYCPYHPDALLEAYRRVSDWRKPEPGMLLDLLRKWDLTPERCMMIGDQCTDVEAAERVGMPGHLFPGGNLHDFLRPLLDAASDRVKQPP
jgi:D,D-heptose 1,7-bisphosphate phosphatase